MKLKIKKLTVKKDDRGWLAEIIRPEFVNSKELGQIFLTIAMPGKTKGGHYHLRKTEWFCVIKGRGLLRIWNHKTNRTLEERELKETNLEIVAMPLKYMHAIKNIGDEDMYLLVYI